MTRQPALALGLAALLACFAASAQDLHWPTQRHDQGRTGRSQGAGGITHPAEYWSYDLGGSLSAGSVWIGDLTGGAQAEITLAQSGRVTVKNAQEQVLWASEPLGADHVIGAWDFDGDGHLELLATADGPPAKLIVLAADSGEVLWLHDSLAPGAAKLWPRMVTVGDPTGDGLPEIVCSAVTNDPDSHTFSFAAGFSQDPVDDEIWSYSHNAYGQVTPHVIGDVDLDGAVEVVFNENQQITIVNGATGALELEATGTYLSHSFGLLRIVDVDSDEQPEIVSIGYKRYNKAVTVFDAVDQAVSWQYQWHPTDGKDLVFSENSVADLDGDGQLEIAVSVYDDADDEYTVNGSSPADHDGVDAPDRWTLLVFDAATGAVEASLQDAYLRGIAPLDPEGDPYLLVQDASGTGLVVPGFGALSAYVLDGDGFGHLWTVDDSAVAAMRVPPSPSADYLDRAVRVAHQGLDLDGVDELYLLRDTDADGEAESLQAVRASVSPPEVIAELALDEHDAARILALGRPLSAPDSSLETAVFRSSGRLQVLSSSFDVAAELRGGGYALSPIVADLDGDGWAELIAGVSTGELRVLDPAADTISELWSFWGATTPIPSATDVDGDGELELAARDNRVPENPAIALLDAYGGELWRAELAGYGNAPDRLLFAELDGDGVTDLVALASDINAPDDGDLRLVALSGADGSELWNVPTEENTYAPAPFQVTDVNGDDIDDVIAPVVHDIECYDGTDGALISAVGNCCWPGQSLLADFDGDLDPELLVSMRNAETGFLLYELMAGAPSWSIPQDYVAQRRHNRPATAAVDPGLGIAVPEPEGNVELFGPGGQSLWGPVWARDGEVFWSDPGGANDIPYVSVADIDGDGGEEAIFGTADGHLIALRIADGSLAWSLPLHSAVHEPVLADVDGDGLLEILAVTGDGFVRMIDQQTLDPIEEVRDTALGAGLTIDDPATDVDVSEVRVALGAAWEPVDGADGYRATALGSDGVPLVPWQDAGGATELVIATAPLPLDRVYRVAVQAYGDGGLTSAEERSDGVLVSDLTPPQIVSFDIQPEVFDPQIEPAELLGEVADASWIESWEIELFDGSAQSVALWSGEPAASQVSVQEQWDGDDELGDPAPDGDYTARLTAYDSGGHLATAWAEVTVDRLAPQPPQIDEPQDGAVLEQAAPQFAGTAEAETLVRLYVDDVESCNAQASAAGQWSCTAGQALADGDHAAAATSEDDATHVSDPSEEVSFSVEAGGADADTDADTDTDADADADADTDTDADADADTDADGDADTDADSETDSETGVVGLGASGGGGCDCKATGGRARPVGIVGVLLDSIG